MLEFIQTHPVLYDTVFSIVQDSLIIAGIAAVLVIITRYID